MPRVYTCALLRFSPAFFGEDGLISRSDEDAFLLSCLRLLLVLTSSRSGDEFRSVVQQETVWSVPSARRARKAEGFTGVEQTSRDDRLSLAGRDHGMRHFRALEHAGHWGRFLVVVALAGAENSGLLQEVFGSASLPQLGHSTYKAVAVVLHCSSERQRGQLEHNALKTAPARTKDVKEPLPFSSGHVGLVDQDGCDLRLGVARFGCFDEVLDETTEPRHLDRSACVREL